MHTVYAIMCGDFLVATAPDLGTATRRVAYEQARTLMPHHAVVSTVRFSS